MVLKCGLSRKDKGIKEKMFWQTKKSRKAKRLQEKIYFQIQGDYLDTVLWINIISFH